MSQLLSSVQNDYSQNYRSIEVTLAGGPVKILLDYYNQRIKVVSYNLNDIALLNKYLNILASGNVFGKIIVIAKEEDFPDFFTHGYKLEGIDESYFSDSFGYYLARFIKNDRCLTPTMIEEDKILDKALTKPIDYHFAPLQSGYQLRDAVAGDITELRRLYDSVFSSYPFPITDPEYMKKLVENNFFKVISNSGRLVSAASAELNRINMSAEITDCVCLPEFEGQGLMYRLIYSLEQDLNKAGFKNLYSIARAKSPGINIVLRKLGYKYSGRLVNNCNICGQYEDMNLWTKKNN